MEINCPSCNKKGKILFKVIEIPHFGECLIYGFNCENCGYRFSDTIPLKEGKYKEEEYEIQEIFNCLIVLSPKSKVIINDKYEYSAGPFSQGEITTVEELIKRIINTFEVHGYDVSELKEILLKKEGTLKIQDELGISKVLKE